jgi:small-conductance mechanosensitive channel
VVVAAVKKLWLGTTTYTRSDRMRRCSLKLAVERGWNPEQIVALLEGVAAASADVLADPPPRAWLVDFGGDRYVYSLSYSIADPLRAFSITASLRLAICRGFAEHGLDPPA